MFGIIGWLIWRGTQAMEYNWQWYRVPRFFYRDIDGEIIPGPLIYGLIETIQLALISGVLAVLIGFVTAFARLSNSIAGRIIATWYLGAIRNTPLLVQLFLFYFVLAPIFGIDHGQYEAGDAIGLTTRESTAASSCRRQCR